MIQREFYLNKIKKVWDREEIKIITGVRRCGKTTILKQIITELKKREIKNENILYISFETAQYKKITNENQLDELIYKKTKNSVGKIYLLFDEIQNVKNWERSINSFRVDLDCDIYITGSNSHLLSGELATLLSGRYITIEIYPLSFKELSNYYKDKNDIELFNHYLSYGGFPGILRYENEEKIDYLRDLYVTITYNDIITKNNISNIDLLERLMEFMVCNIGNTFSANSITKYMKNENQKTTTNTIINYINNVTKAFIFYQVKRRDIKLKKKLLISDKYYLVDPAFYYLFNNENERNWGQLLENIVFIELKRRGYDINIGKIYDLEIDFICKKLDKKIYIQVSQSIIDTNTRKKELKTLKKVKDNYPKYIITMDQYNFSNEGITHLNIIDFLKSSYNEF